VAKYTTASGLPAGAAGDRKLQSGLFDEQVPYPDNCHKQYNSDPDNSHAADFR
jgi:hypothetical protein